MVAHPVFLLNFEVIVDLAILKPIMTTTSDMLTEKQLNEEVIPSSGSSSVENGDIEHIGIDKKLERRIMLRRDFILLPTIGLLYMIVSPASRSCPAHAHICV